MILERVKTGTILNGQWVCLLECGCTVPVAAIKRPRFVEHEHDPGPVEQPPSEPDPVAAPT